jgi:uncharacterized cupin superfamily protein
VTTTDPVPCLLRAADLAALAERRHVHQFDDDAVRHTRSPGDVLGLQRLGLHLVRLEPGRVSTTFHYHEQDEEFLLILEGRGIAEIGEHETGVGPGDLMAFPANSPGHRLRNPFDAHGRTLFKAHGARRAALDSDLEDV